MSDSKTLLLLGGNGFIGAEVVEYLLNENESYKLVLLNRGNWKSWDYETKIKPKITENIIWDRKCDSIKNCLKNYLDDKSFQFEAIIDFSAYKKRDIKNVLDEIPFEKFKQYILISTDSIYEVCDLQDIAADGSVSIKEENCFRPKTESEIKYLKKLDSYGHHKFKCEEKLLSYAKSNENLNYVMLRLPDVIGARDSLERFWFYQMWLQYLDKTNSNTPNEILIPKAFLSKKTSYVYVKDVAKAIGLILKSNIKNEIFNIGFDRSLTLIEFITLIGTTIKNGSSSSLNLKFVSVENDCYTHSFPSVTKGEIIIDKIKEILHFQPTQIEQAFKETVDFYNRAYKEFPKERKIIENSLKKEILNKHDFSKFDEFIKEFST